MPTRQEVIAYITESARRYGIDPKTSLRVFQQESGLNPAAKNINRKEESYGLGQLNVKGGMGVEARRRGIEPSDPSQWQKHVDLVHQTVKKDGWRQWYGARDVGIGRWQGVGSSDTKSASYNPTNVRPPKNIDIGATPQLAQLSPAQAPAKKRDPNAVATSILTQSSPMTEGNNMARYPGFNEAIRQSMTGNTENVEAVPSSFIPPDTDLKGRVKLAGAIPSGTLRAPKTKATPKGTKAGAHKDVPDAPEQMGGSYADYVKKEKAKMAEEKKKLDDAEIPKSGQYKSTVPDAADQIGAPPYPAGVPGAGGKKVKTDTVSPRDITGPLAAVGAGGAYTAFSDPALQSVIDTINGAGNPPPAITDAPLPPNVPQARGGTTDPALQRVMEVLSVGPSGGRGDLKDPTGGQLNQPSPAPGRGGYNVDPQIAIVEKALGMKPGTMGDPNSGTGAILAQAMPAFQQAMANPRTRQAAMETAKGIVSSKAQIDSQAAARGGGRDATYYQREASRLDPSDPQYERMMQIAVARDAQSRGPSPRGVVPGQQQRPPMQSAPAALPQEQIPMPRPRPADAPQMQQPQPGVPMPRPRPPEAPLIPNNHSFVQNPTDQILQEFYSGQSTGGGIMP